MSNPLPPQDPNRAIARHAAALWGIDPIDLEHVADRGNSVYRGQLNDQIVYLRLTNPEYRSKSELQGELDFVKHLHQQKVKVAAPIWSANQLWVEEVYVYLSRLWYFGEQPTPEQQTILTRLRNIVLKRIWWQDQEVGQSWRTG